MAAIPPPNIIQAGGGKVKVNAATGGTAVTVPTSLIADVIDVTDNRVLAANLTNAAEVLISTNWQLSNGAAGNYTVTNWRGLDIEMAYTRDGAATPTFTNVDVLRLSVAGSPNDNGTTFNFIMCKESDVGTVFYIDRSGTLNFPGPSAGLQGIVNWNGSTRKLQAVNHDIVLEVSGGFSAGTNSVGGDLQIEGGQSTGNANGGNVLIQVSPPGGSGSATNALVNVATFSAVGNVALGRQTVAGTTDTDGFIYVRNCAGAPTGVPATTLTGLTPMRYDTVNHKVWFYDAGWKGVVVA